MKSESETQQLIQMLAPAHHCILLRNNVGALKDEIGRVVRYGLGHISSKQNKISKSSDLIGLTTIVITQKMVGTTVAVFTAVEVKKEGWVFKENDTRAVAQKAFIDWVKLRGGLSGFASSVEQFVGILRK